MTNHVLWQNGHPVVLKNGIFDEILQYSGEGGLRGALRTLRGQTSWLSLDDEGIVMSVHNDEQIRSHLRRHNNAMLTPNVRIRIEKETPFFGSRLKLLLFLIADIHSVQQACKHMGLSYSNAWVMINRLEQEVGYAVVERKQGGSRGGHTYLTEKGFALVHAYQMFEIFVKEYSRCASVAVSGRDGADVCWKLLGKEMLRLCRTA